ncbi:type III secretion HpaP family protein [uncultured Endozoicomonas sp.]|uniref:type III secretion HpaP family protein n=1 Tax=uncultured Endozoicomonas sp. TaxID=432652 RepID=UPI0026350E35|nr:type III secretion HpaP family protein [uncultured Endozoicomonas sp.]
MDSLTPGGKSQLTPSAQDYNKQSRQVSERQASDFADRMVKERRAKEKNAENNKNNPEAKKTDDGDQSLESLLAERSQKSKDAIKEREGGQEFQNEQDGAEHALLQSTKEGQIKSDLQLREIQQTNNVKEVEAALNKLADQIKVSAKDAINGAEVRISMKDSVLPGTEIRIQRGAGELTVTMNTSSAEAGNFLAQHEAGLQKLLADRFSNDRVQVNVNLAGSNNQDTDGRSRNQYVAEENDQNSSNRQA